MQSKVAHDRAYLIMEELEQEGIRIADNVWFAVFDTIEEHVQDAIEEERARCTKPSEN